MSAAIFVASFLLGSGGEFLGAAAVRTRAVVRLIGHAESYAWRAPKESLAPTWPQREMIRCYARYSESVTVAEKVRKHRLISTTWDQPL